MNWGRGEGAGEEAGSSLGADQEGPLLMQAV